MIQIRSDFPGGNIRVLSVEGREVQLAPDLFHAKLIFQILWQFRPKTSYHTVNRDPAGCLATGRSSNPVTDHSEHDRLFLNHLLFYPICVLILPPRTTCIHHMFQSDLHLIPSTLSSIIQLPGY